MVVVLFFFPSECLKHQVIPFRPSEDMEPVVVPVGLKKNALIMPSREKIIPRNSGSTPYRSCFSDTMSAGCLESINLGCQAAMLL